jgi:hypothetical protein
MLGYACVAQISFFLKDRMSEMGQEPASSGQPSMSALPLKADMGSKDRNYVVSPRAEAW